MTAHYCPVESTRLRRLYRERSHENLARIRALTGRHYRLDRNDTLTVVINQGCRLGCRSCFRTPEAARTMDSSLFATVAGYAARHFHSLSVTGGEPTESIELVREVAGNYPDLRINLTTNAEQFDHATLAALRASPNIYPILSLNGMGAVHDASRHPGSFIRIVQTIEGLREWRIPFGILMTINRTNMAQLISGELAAFVDNVGACTLELFQFYPIGTGARNGTLLALSSRDMDESLTYRDRLERTNPYGFLYRSAQTPGKKCHRALQVFIDGEVSYCPFSVWGFDRIIPADSDQEIRRKLERHLRGWEALRAQTPSYCPLQSNTNGYIDFFSTTGAELWRPTGLLDKSSEQFTEYCQTAGESRRLTPGNGERAGSPRS